MFFIGRLHLQSSRVKFNIHSFLNFVDSDWVLIFAFTGGVIAFEEPFGRLPYVKVHDLVFKRDQPIKMEELTVITVNDNEFTSRHQFKKNRFEQ